jgi:hypothetical protein
MLLVNMPVLMLYRVKSFSTADPADEPYYFCGLDSHDVHGPRLFASFFAFAYVGPLTIIATMYFLILRFLRNRRRQSMLDGSTSTSSSSAMRRSRGGGGSSLGQRRGAATSEVAASAAGGAVVRSRGRRRTSYATRVFLAVVVVFGLCWLPLHAHLLLVMFNRQPTTRAYAIWRVVCHTLAYANSSVNPFIYHYVSADFRRSLNCLLADATASCRHRLARSSTIMAAATDGMTRQRASSASYGVLGGGGGCAGDGGRGADGSPGAAAAARAALGGMHFDAAALKTPDDTVSIRRTMTTHVEMCRLPTGAQRTGVHQNHHNIDNDVSSQGPSL